MWGKAKYYDTIETLPVNRWFKIHETGDYSLLLINKKRFDLKKLAQVWDKIYVEFLNVFGVPEHLRKFLIEKREIDFLEIEKQLTGDRSLDTLIEIKRFEMDKIFPKQEKGHNLVISALKKFMGIQYSDKTTVKEFYTDLEYMQHYGRE